MADTSLRDELNRSLEGRFRRGTDYNAVAVLVIYWKACIDKGYRAEAHELGGLFSNDFGYLVQYYEIPATDSELEMDKRVNEYLREHRNTDTLLIIHYGGHGNPDDDHGQHQESVWCEEPTRDSPSLKWSNIQPKLQLHKSEVLVLLDCCYGSQAARESQSRRRSPIPSNVELFAACGMGEKTACPGPHSFTTLLIAEIRAQLASDKSAVVAIAHKNLAAKEARFQQAAVYFPLEKKKATICLEPLLGPAVYRKAEATEATSLILRLSITDKDREALEDVINWLKIDPPRTIANIVIDQLIISASAAVKYASSQDIDCRATVDFHNLPEPAQKDVLSSWNDFTVTVTKTAAVLSRVHSWPGSSDPSAKSNISEEMFNELETSIKSLQMAIERNTICLPEYIEKDNLLRAIDDNLIKDLGFAEILHLRLVAHFGSEPMDLLEVAFDESTNTFTSDDPFAKLSIKNVPQLGKVLVECRKYDTASTEWHILETAKKRLQKLAELLSSSKSADFHTLTCLRFFHDPQQSSYGLFFGIPEESRELHITLRDIIRKTHGKSKPTLDQRLQIAYKIGRAISKWHLVNWVHQGIASYNVVFFLDRVRGIDYSRPYLCGFEYSREAGAPSAPRYVEDFELNVYRHPDRQGVPNKSHRKEHDIYAYGVMLLELGLWKLVGNCFEAREKEKLSPLEMYTEILKASQYNLGHFVGSLYEKATSTCLSGDFGVSQDDSKQAQLAKAFETLVLERIGKGVCNTKTTLI